VRRTASVSQPPPWASLLRAAQGREPGHPATAFVPARLEDDLRARCAAAGRSRARGRSEARAGHPCQDMVARPPKRSRNSAAATQERLRRASCSARRPARRAQAVQLVRQAAVRVRARGKCAGTRASCSFERRQGSSRREGSRRARRVAVRAALDRGRAPAGQRHAHSSGGVAQRGAAWARVLRSCSWIRAVGEAARTPGRRPKRPRPGARLSGRKRRAVAQVALPRACPWTRTSSSSAIRPSTSPARRARRAAPRRTRARLARSAELVGRSRARSPRTRACEARAATASTAADALAASGPAKCSASASQWACSRAPRRLVPVAFVDRRRAVSSRRAPGARH
jgi:hypothetical protein